MAVDGKVIEGASSLDESAVTGESIPVQKSVGDRVISASINTTGSFKFQAEKVGEDTTISQIIKLVDEANQSKAPIAKLADKIAGVFVPTVLIIAAITLEFGCILVMDLKMPLTLQFLFWLSLVLVH